MKAFNLEQALAGKPVVTRDGQSVTQLVLFKNINSPYPLHGVRLYGVGPGDVNAWSIEGKHYTIGSHSNDLFMTPEKKEGWINIYKDVYAPNGVSVSKVYNTEAEAKSVWVSALAICKITWEE